MAIFDIEKDELLRLSDVQLEELIARLAEAEVALHGHSPARVSWSGSINAPDGGIDVHIQVPVDKLSTGFIERPDTIFQAKKQSMPKAEITKEMTPNGKLIPAISEQAKKGGSYIIVSLSDDCTPPMQGARLKAMQDAVEGYANSSNIHLGFYDRSKLAQWLRQHPSVMLWVKRILGRGYSGWQPYGAWSNPPKGVVDTLISAPGVRVSLPAGKGENLSIEDAIGPMRDIIRNTNKAIRIIGLSGVGKTRIVQALFDETVGIDALDRTGAVYVDTGDGPEPSATAVLDRLIAKGQPAIMILDNCSSELHSSLARKVSAAGGKVSLITIEYDIRDDKPQTTEVIYIEAVGPEVAKQLLIQRFPNIDRNNAYLIAKSAGGNAKVSLAIAERVETGESLDQLSDAQLFNRLFEQRNQPNDDLREQAEILSLVYSFSVSNPGMGQNELEVLGSLSEYGKNRLSRAVKKLLDRHVVQKRGHWRAILPHAIANKLAASALDSISVVQLRPTFESHGRQRLLMSFAHRLGLLHNHPVAKEIVEAWLQPKGLLGRILQLEDALTRILEYIGPVVPETLLDRIEAEFTATDFKGMLPRNDPHWTTILNLLQALAYEPTYFERCARLLIQVVDYEEENNNHDTARQKLTVFFQAYLSGTHASLDQRITIMKECLSAHTAARRSLGLKMLSTALDGPPWSGVGLHEFGARPRDYGFQPNPDELVQWRSTFINVAVLSGTSGNPSLEGPARLILAEKFRGMWQQEAMRGILVDAARKLHAYHPYSDGWKAVRSIIYYNYTNRQNNTGFEPLPDSLTALERELKPKDLVPTIMNYVLSNGRDCWMLDDHFNYNNTDRYEAEKRCEARALLLGKEFAASNHKLDELGPNLFSCEWMPYHAAFGKGLAKGAYSLRIAWQQLVEHLEQQPEINKSFAVFGGFIEEAVSIDPALAQGLLDQCAQHPELRHVLVGLHPPRDFTESDLERCIALLDDPDIHPKMYGPILWWDEYANLPGVRIFDIAQRLLSKPGGDDVVLDALNMRIHDKERVVNTLGPDLRLIGLRAATQRFQRDHSDLSGSTDYCMERVVDAALRFNGNEVEKLEWLDTIFAVVDEHYGCIHSFKKTIGMTAALMPEVFLNRVLEGTEEQQHRRLIFIGRCSPLAKIGVGVLIEWCRTKMDSRAWPAVAAGINLWPEDDDREKITVLDAEMKLGISSGAVTLSETAMRLLEGSPEPQAILEVFANSVTPSSCVGSVADVMQFRADAIGKLVNHKRADISKAASTVFAKLVKSIKYEKEFEQQRDEEREQRFE